MAIFMNFTPRKILSRVNKERRMAEACRTHAEFWLENLKERDHSEDPACLWEDNIKMDLQEIG